MSDSDDDLNFSPINPDKMPKHPVVDELFDITSDDQMVIDLSKFTTNQKESFTNLIQGVIIPMKQNKNVQIYSRVLDSEEEDDGTGEEDHDDEEEESEEEVQEEEEEESEEEESEIQEEEEEEVQEEAKRYQSPGKPMVIAPNLPDLNSYNERSVCLKTKTSPGFEDKELVNETIQKIQNQSDIESIHVFNKTTMFINFKTNQSGIQLKSHQKLIIGEINIAIYKADGKPIPSNVRQIMTKTYGNNKVSRIVYLGLGHKEHTTEQLKSVMKTLGYNYLNIKVVKKDSMNGHVFYNAFIEMYSILDADKLYNDKEKLETALVLNPNHFRIGFSYRK